MPDSRSSLTLARAVAGVERTLHVVQAMIDHLPSSAVTAARLGQISQLEATRARLEHELETRTGRWPEGSILVPRLPPGPPVVLFLPASPWGPDALEDEARAIDRAVRTGGRLAFQSLADAGTDALLRMFDGDRQRALHLSGRGRDGTLVLHGDDGQAAPVSSGPLTTIVRELGDELRLVVLHARDSRDLGRALAASVPCVIALDGGISAPTARMFFEAFYRALGDGDAVQAAFDAGCRTLAMVAIAAARMPVLLCRPDVAADRVALCDH